MAVVFKILNWLLEFLPDDSMREAVLLLVNKFWADGVQEGGNAVAVCMSFVAYYLPVDTMFECFKLITICVGAAFTLCVGKVVFTWLIALIDLFFDMFGIKK